MTGRPRGRPPRRRRRTARQRLEDEVRRTYKTPGHPTAFSAPATVAKFHGINKELAKEILEGVESYVTHREYKRPRAFNAYMIKKRRDFMQADVIDMSALSRMNGGVKYILLIIDCFTRFVWLFPLRSKSGGEMARVLDGWLSNLDAVPRAFSTDLGKEFFNADVADVMRRYGVDHQKAVGTCKAAMAERANKTVQILIYKYMSDRNTRKYIDVLDELAKTYNTRGHRSLKGRTPEKADDPANEAKVLKIHRKRYAAVPRQWPKFKPNEVVRIKEESRALQPSSRAYNPQFKDELFYIDYVSEWLPVPLYHLKAAETDEAIEGGFYSNELTRVGGDVWKVERIIQRRGRGPNAKVLVKWQGFGDRWNSWVNAKDVRDV
jgi:hypothetical protein